MPKGCSRIVVKRDTTEIGYARALAAMQFDLIGHAPCMSHMQQRQFVSVLTGSVGGGRDLREDCDVVADTAANHEQVPDRMRITHAWAMVKNSAQGIGRSTGQEPAKGPCIECCE